MLILITYPTAFPDETTHCNLLFQDGLQTLHLRKPDFSETEYEQFIHGIDARFRNRIVVHDHFGLVEKYGLKGVHLSAKKQRDLTRKPEYRHVSASCHSFEEIRNLPFDVDYCFLSPIFDSISKEDYTKAFSEEEIRKELPTVSVPVVALGGVNAANLWRVYEMGFSGAALLGAIWNNSDTIMARWRELNTPKVLSIAGFDPSSGAGVTSDIQTMEATGRYGLGVCSGITFQNQDTLNGVQWLSLDAIWRQSETLFEKNYPRIIKIGIIENLSILNELCDRLLAKIPEAQIIWDPILRASSGYEFQNDLSLLPEILRKVYLITPNSPEMQQLFGENISLEAIPEISEKFNLHILWKGGHNNAELSEDVLITPANVMHFSVLRSGSEKHGTGCVFSSAVASFLAQGFSLETACSKAQVYVSAFMRSADGKLGLHRKNNPMKPSISDIRLMYITDFDEKISLAEQAENACRGGAKLVQLRMKGAPESELLRQADLVKSVCERHNALFIVNDHPRVARQVDADGVHLGKEDVSPAEARTILGDEKIIGATCNTFEDVINAYKSGADYVGVGPFRFTTTKKNLSPVLGMDGYREICKKMRENFIHLPVFAIGGITSDDIDGLMTCGVQGMALSSYIKNSRNMELKTKSILQTLHAFSENRNS